MPVAAYQRDAYAEAMGRAIDAAVKASDHGVEGAARIVTRAYEDLAHQIAQTSPSLWTRQGLAAIQSTLAETVAQMGDDLASLMGEGIVAGVRGADAAVLGSLGPDGVGVVDLRVLAKWPAIPSQLVNVAANFAADLITEVEKDTRDEIAGFVRNSIFTGKSQIATMQQVVGALEGGAGTPLQFGNLLNRAEVIYRTESLRVFSLATEVRGAQLAEAFPGTLKWWDSTGDSRTRDSHLECEERTKDAPIPFEALFKVGKVRLRFPRDPGGEGDERELAAETIQCRCGCRFVLPTDRGEAPAPDLYRDVASDLTDDLVELRGVVL